MSVMDHHEEPRQGGMAKILLMGAAAIALVALIVMIVTVLTRKAPEPTTAPSQARTEAPPPVAAPKTHEPEKETAPAAARRPRPRREKPVEAAPAPPLPAGPGLVVESDVPGADVFVDRAYLGKTPLRTRAVAAGSHQLNASVTGEDGLARTVEIAESGDTTVTLRFKEVQLNASVAVVHKHAMGSCEGRLAATADGLRYDTPNRKDAFVIPLNSLEVFAIDYLKKELKVKQKGGKTWNFTDKSENADKLFVFYRDVSMAREKLAARER